MGDLGLGSLVKETVAWEGDPVRRILSPNDSRVLVLGWLQRFLRSCLRKIGCRCVLDESVKRDSCLHS